MVSLSNLFALSFLALLSVLGTVTALSLDTPHVHLARHHDIALKKRDSSSQRRCRPRSSSSPAVTHVHNTTSVQDNKPTPSSSPVPHPTNTVTSNSVNSNNAGSMPKIGIAYDSSNYGPLQFFKTPKVGPFYNWSPYCPPEVKTMGFTCCPMLWGYKQISDFQNLVKPGYASCALGMNEPNEPSQSNMSPEAAVSMWKEYLDPLADHGFTLMSPACTNGPSGITWYKSFFAGCTGCRIHALATHFYGTDPTAMINYLIELHNTFNMQIWVTEFACMDFSYQKPCPSPYEFLVTVKKFMDNTEWVQAYFAFGVLDNMYNVDPADQLLGSNGQPTSLGWEYIS